LLAILVGLALASFAGAVMLGASGAAMPAAHVHLAFAVGVMPLILGAMTHFVPVLTRSQGPARGISLLPVATTVAGALALFSFAFPEVGGNTYYGGALLALAAVGVMAGWMRRRGGRSLGAPHPGLHWYLAAVACLALALAAVLAMSLWPEQRVALKRLHLHLNLLGFVGLTAIGTLQVLLPTAVGRPDARAASRLRGDLKLALAGTLLTAVGAGWLDELAWAGMALWLFPVARMLGAWWGLYRGEIFRLHGAAPSLAAASAGFAGALLAGGLHADGQPATGHAHAFVAGFMFPLVTGAASQLLPVWLRSGPQTGWHGALRACLTRWGGLRALLFLCGGLALGAGWKWGWGLAAVALGLFIGQLAAEFFGRKTMLNDDAGLE
jgi:hypothetical protein